MIKSNVVMHHFILTMIQGSWRVQSPSLPTPWIDRNSELRMAGNMSARVLLIGFLWQKSLWQQAEMGQCFTNHSGQRLLG